MIKEIKKSKPSKKYNVTDYYITFDNEVTIQISTLLKEDILVLHSLNFEDNDVFKDFILNQLFKSKLFYDRLRIVLHNHDKILIACQKPMQFMNLYEKTYPN